MSLESEFEDALRGTYDAARKRGYVATYFLKMLEEHGGVGTAKQLLAKSEPQAGLFELWRLDLLDESLEAVALRERFIPLFTREELAEAHRRLSVVREVESAVEAGLARAGRLRQFVLRSAFEGRL